MSAPPPPLPPRPPGMLKSMPPLPYRLPSAPGSNAISHSHAAPGNPHAPPLAPRPMPPMPPNMSRPPPNSAAAGSSAVVDASRYLAPPSSYVYRDPPAGASNGPDGPYHEYSHHRSDNADRYYRHASDGGGASPYAPSGPHVDRSRAAENAYRSHPSPSMVPAHSGGHRASGYPAPAPQHRPYTTSSSSSAGAGADPYYPHPVPPSHLSSSSAAGAGASSRYAPYDDYPPHHPSYAPYPTPDRYYHSGEAGEVGSHRTAAHAHDDSAASYAVYPPRAPPTSASAGGSARRRHHDDAPIPLREATNTVWVGNLDLTVHTDEALREAMREFGLVMRVARQAEKTYCFVHFRHVEEARRAVEVLTQRGTLGQAKFNYGKMFEYSAEEMNRPYDPDDRSSHMSSGYSRRRTGGSASDAAAEECGGRHGERPPLSTRRTRPEREPMERSNVLWVGSLPPSVTDDTLRDVFEVFGTITHISRMDKGGMAFVYFDTEEHCTLALQTMKGRPIDGGVVLALNYGHAQRTGASHGGANPGGAAAGAGGDPHLDADGIHVNEVPTNVVYLGQLPSDIEDRDVEALFEPYEGFINSKYISSNNIGFGHFDSVERARAARIGLNHTTLKGTPIRVNFGKNNHTLNLPTAAARKAAALADAGAEGGFNLDEMMRDPADGAGVDGGVASAMALTRAHDGADGGGALVASGPGSYRMDSRLAGGGALVLPGMGGGAQAGGGHGDGGYAERDALLRERPAPKLTLDVHLNTLLGSTYNELGAHDLEMSPSQIQAICSMVDYTVDEASAQRLDDAVSLYTPLKCVHAFNVVAKRTREYFIDDPHKKMLILYAVTRALLGADTRFVPFNSAGLNAYLVNLVVASEGQTSSGADRLCSIVESLKESDFVRKKARVDDDYVEEFRAQMDDVVYRVKAEQDLSTFLTRKRRR